MQTKVAGIEFYTHGKKTSEALVLGHALGATHRIWDKVAEALAERYYVITWDQPGHGGSDLLNEPYGMAEIVDRLLAGLGQLGVTTFNLGGISLGGMVSLALAQTAPERVRRLIVCDAGASLLPAEPWIEKAKQARESGTASLAPATMQRWFTSDFAGSPQCAAVEEEFRACSDEGYAQCCEVIGSTDLTQDLGKLTMPTLLLTGVDDPGMTPQQLAELSTLIPGAKGISTVVANAGHLTCVEQPDAVLAAIDAVLASDDQE